MKHWKAWLVLISISSIGLYIADWYFTRLIHYKMSYESLVKAEVRSMVKATCLQE